MISELTAKVLFSYESKEGENLSEIFGNFLQGLMSFPLNIPGTAFHKCKTVEIQSHFSQILMLYILVFQYQASST